MWIDLGGALPSPPMLPYYTLTYLIHPPTHPPTHPPMTLRARTQINQSTTPPPASKSIHLHPTYPPHLPSEQRPRVSREANEPLL